MILIERLALLVGYGLIAAACGLGLATGLMLLTDTKFRKAFATYWKKELL